MYNTIKETIDETPILDEIASMNPAETPLDIPSVVSFNIIAPERRFPTDAVGNPEKMAKIAREMLDKGIVPIGYDEGILRGDDPRLMKAFSQPLPPVCPTPYKSLNELLGGGLETSSINIVTAETGIGKSTFTGELMHHYLQSGCAIGMCALEDTHSRTAKRMVSIATSHNYMVEEVLDGDEIYRKHLSSPRYYQYNDFGAVNRAIPFIMRLEGLCITMKNEHPDIPRWMLIDHISMLVTHSGSEERQALDSTMNDLMRIANTHNIGMIVICHLSRANVSGASIINRLRGSGGIGQMANTVISIDRLDISETGSEADRNTLKVHVSKNRRTGTTGLVSGTLIYSKETGRLKEVEDFSDASNDFTFDFGE